MIPFVILTWSEILPREEGVIMKIDGLDNTLFKK